MNTKPFLHQVAVGIVVAFVLSVGATVWNELSGGIVVRLLGGITVDQIKHDPEIRKLLQSLEGVPDEQPSTDTNSRALLFGVPSGSVLPWFPTLGIEASQGTDGRTIANPPQGWVVCDGQNSEGREIPDLRGRFIVGADHTIEGLSFAQLGGQYEHSHLVKIGASTRDEHRGSLDYAKNAAHKDHVHETEIRSASSMPRYLSLLFICKL